MTVTDITLIYFSIGAPFAVYEIVRNGPPLTIARTVPATVALFAWPVSAFRMLRLHFRTGNVYRDFADERTLDSETEYRIDAFRERLQVIGASDFRGTSIFEFRELFDRYAGLTLAANPKYLDSSIGTEFFHISGREDSVIGEKCLNRRNRAKLSRHQTKARDSFLEFIDNLPDLSQRTAAAEMALELAYLLNDGTAAGHLENFLKAADTVEDLTWNSGTPQQYQTTPQARLSTLAARTGSSKTD